MPRYQLLNNNIYRINLSLPLISNTVDCKKIRYIYAFLHSKISGFRHESLADRICSIWKLCTLLNVFISSKSVG